MPEHRLVRLGSAHLFDLRLALRRAGLPVDGIDGPGMIVFRLDDEAGTCGWAALERHDAEALLRSVVIAEGRRGGGAGTELVHGVLRAAAAEGIERFWLLTETAAPFFARLGFSPVSREQAPAAIRSTAEFARLCPATAQCMTRAL